MAELEPVLATVRERVAKYRTQAIGEQDTKATLIAPVLRGLGWNTEDLEDVKLEYKRLANDNLNRTDFGGDSGLPRVPWSRNI
jgi:hypothetical protein